MKKWLISLVILGGLANGLLLKGIFIWDDQLFIVNNPHIRNIEVKEYFTKPYWRLTEGVYGYRSFYRPLVLLSFSLEYKIYKLSPWGYRLTNIIFHTASSLLLFLVLISVGLKKEVSFYSAALFSSAATLREPVAWISSRGDILALFFLLLSLYFFLKGKDRLSLLIYPFALFSKEMAVSFPFLLFLFLYFRKGKLKRTLPFFIMDVAYIIIRSFITSAGLLFSGRNLISLSLESIEASGFYFLQGIFPFTGRVFLSPSSVLRNPIYIIPGLIFIGLSLALLFKRDKIFFLSASSLLLLLPSLAVVWGYYPHRVAFRYGYIPSVFLFPLLLIFLSLNKNIKKILLPTVLIASLANANIINLYWTSKSSYWMKAHRDAPEEKFFILKYSLLKFSDGKFDETMRLIKPYLSSNTKYTPAFLQLAGLVMERRKNLKMAEVYFSRALHHWNKQDEMTRKKLGNYVLDYHSVYLSLARVLEKEGKTQEAERILLKGYPKYGMVPKYKDTFAVISSLNGNCKRARELAINLKEQVEKVCDLWEKGDPFSKAKLSILRNQFKKARKACYSLKEDREKCLKELEKRKNLVLGE